MLVAVPVALLFLSLLPQCMGQCEEAAKMAEMDLNLKLNLQNFTTDTPIQNIIMFKGYVYVGAVNKIYVLNENLTKISEYKTGPLLKHSDCLPCKNCTDNLLSPNGTWKDSVNMALFVEDFYDDQLISCGNIRKGECQRHTLHSDKPWDIASDVHCLYSSQMVEDKDSCPDCIVSTAGSKILVTVGDRFVKFFVGSTLTGQPSTIHSVSVRRLKETQDGFEYLTDQSYIDVLPHLRDIYPIRYIYTFESNNFVYFLTVQRESLDSQAYHTRIVRICSSDSELRSYIEMPLECIFTEKRRKRSTASAVFNIVQAAYLGRAGEDLAEEMGVKPDDDILYGVFAQSKPDSPEANNRSAVCAVSVKTINEFFNSAADKQNTKCLEHF